MSKRKYTHIQSLLPKIKALVAAGMSQREIADRLGIENKRVIKDLLYRRNRQEASIPKQRGRKPAKTLQEYKYENKRLRMENELLRDFLQSTERK